MDEAQTFERLVSAIVARFLAQNDRALPPASELARLATQLRALLEERGLPKPLAPDELGVPGGMAEEICAPLVAKVLAGVAGDALLAEAARQLVKACFYPEFKVCRDSYREVARDGACRRQQLERVRGRTSGSHCVDCPHWVAQSPEQHAALLERAWCGDPAVFIANRNVFLPEDFRALRLWLYKAARREDR